jgi:hypothetical protein
LFLRLEEKAIKTVPSARTTKSIKQQMGHQGMVIPVTSTLIALLQDTDCARWLAFWTPAALAAEEFEAISLS